MTWEVIDFKDNEITIQNNLTKEIRKWDASKVQTEYKEHYNNEGEGVRGIFVYTIEKDYTFTQKVVKIIPASKLDNIDYVYPEECYNPTILPKLLCVGTHADGYDAEYVINLATGNNVTDKHKWENAPFKILTEMIPVIMRGYNYDTYIRTQLKTSPMEVAFIGDFGHNIKFFNYYVMNFISKAKEKSMLNVYDAENNQIINMSVEDLYKHYMDWYKNIFPTTTNFFYTYMNRNYNLMGWNIPYVYFNFTNVWMLDKTHIAFRMKNGVSVINISNILQAEDSLFKESKVAVTYSGLLMKGIQFQDVYIQNQQLTYAKMGTVGNEGNKCEYYNLPLKITSVGKHSIEVMPQTSVYPIKLHKDIVEFPRDCFANKLGYVLYEIHLPDIINAAYLKMFAKNILPNIMTNPNLSLASLDFKEDVKIEELNAKIPMDCIYAVYRGIYREIYNSIPKYFCSKKDIQPLINHYDNLANVRSYKDVFVQYPQLINFILQSVFYNLPSTEEVVAKFKESYQTFLNIKPTLENLYYRRYTLTKNEFIKYVLQRVNELGNKIPLNPEKLESYGRNFYVDNETLQNQSLLALLFGEDLYFKYMPTMFNRSIYIFMGNVLDNEAINNLRQKDLTTYHKIVDTVEFKEMLQLYKQYFAYITGRSEKI